ncbi:MAG: adenylate/guanylate cyclase domain-containing protein [Geminicoccaceae bacterium]|nr:MAG: adenylate/guanylate cyclase domain-containing protein [Geminicoccaceae bacterium]
MVRHDVLPLRDRLLAEAEIEAERTVGWVRLFVALALAVVLVAAMTWLAYEPPRRGTGGGVGAAVRLGDWRLGNAWLVVFGFVLLGLASLWAAKPGRLQPWMPWAFTTGDGLLVLANLNFSLTNQGFSAAFAPLFPAVWVAPLVVSFGVLRYRPGLQAYAGLLLLAGLAWLAFAQADAPSRHLPEHLFAAMPNAARIAMFTGLVAILVLAAYRRRVLLTRTIDEFVRRAEYQRYLPPEVAGLVAEGQVERLRRGWRTDAAILLVDIRAFTRRAEGLAPDELGRFVTAFRRRVLTAVTAHGGMVDKFVGDGAVILFGVPDSQPDAAARALACAKALAQDLRTVAENPVEVAIGAHWGEVFAGAVGDEERLEFTVLGDSVNVASRLEAVAKAMDLPLVASQALLDAAGAAAEAGFDLLPYDHVRGREAQLTYYGWRG